MSVHTTSTTDDEITKALYATLLKPLVVQWIGRILAEDVMWVRFLPRGHDRTCRVDFVVISLCHAIFLRFERVVNVLNGGGKTSHRQKRFLHVNTHYFVF